MLSIRPLTPGAAGYYSAEAEAAAPEAREPSQAVDEYYSAETAETPGRWWSATGELVPNGAEVRPGELKAALDGFGQHGEALVQNAGKADRAGGFDLCFSAPKGVSALYAAAETDVRKALLADVRASAEAGLRFLHEQGAFGTRRGKGGGVREAARDVRAAVFPQATSRAGQPQLHAHAVVANAALRADTTTGTLEATRVFAWKGAAGAVFRAELAHRLEARGLAVEADGQAFRVVGVDGRLVRHWSARRDQVLAGAAGGKLKGKAKRVAQQMAALRTRAAKGAVPADLDRQWRSDIEAHGHTPAGMWQGARTAAEGRQRPQGSAAEAAVREAFARGSVATERTLRRLVAEAAQTRGGGARAVQSQSERLFRDGGLVKLGQDRKGETVFTTPEALARERRILRNAVDRRGERSVIRPEAVERAVARRAAAGGKPLSAEQEKAVRHTAAGGGVVAIEGLAGVGKSFALAAVTEAARDSGARVVALAPSWQAAEVLSADTGERARALQGFVRDLDKGAERLDGPTVVVLDEAGMAGAGDVDRLLGHARRSGAQVVLAGDRGQLRAVEPGAPFTSIADELGVARMEAVRRQGQKWMRNASVRMGNGDVAGGLRDYDARGRMLVARDADQARAAVVEVWAANRLAHPDASRLVLAGRNDEVHALNAELRQRRLDAGELGPEALTVRTLHSGGRNGEGQVREMELRAGDRVAVGAVNLTRDGRDVLPNDLATVRGFTAGADPVLALRMDRTGQDAVVRMSELIPKHDGAEAGPRAPAIQHGYARTVHKSQGATVDYCIALGGDGLDSARAYVAMTRHRHDAALVVDGGAIRARLMAEDKPHTPEAVRNAFLDAAKGRPEGVNASEFIVDKAHWLETGETERPAAPEARDGRHSRCAEAMMSGADPAHDNEGRTMVAGAGLGGLASAMTGGGASIGASAGATAGASASSGLESFAQGALSGLQQSASDALQAAPVIAEVAARGLKEATETREPGPSPSPM